jgi:hypothetical protein
MAVTQVPVSRTVSVNLYRNRFPQIAGFGVPLFVTTVAVSGTLDASNRTKTYASMDEVAADFAATTEAYKAANAAFSQRPQPLQIKIGFATAPTGAGDLTDELNAIEDADSGWYWIDVDKTLRDGSYIQELVDWCESRRKIALITSNAADTEDAADTATVAAANKGEVERTAVFYSTDANSYGGFSLASKLGTFDFDESGSAYTAKYKRLNGEEFLSKTSTVVQAITGFVPGIGQDTTTGNCANCYVKMKDLGMVVEGSTLTPNLFIDDVHFGDWLIARMEEKMLGILTNAKRVPMDQRGMAALAQGAEEVLAKAFRSGLIAEDTDEQGDLAPAYTVTIPDVFTITEAQRKNRIAPAIEVFFRSAGAVHYVTVNLNQSY